VRETLNSETIKHYCNVIKKYARSIYADNYLHHGFAPEKLVHELLLGAGRLGHDLDGQGCCVVLVLGHAGLGWAGAVHTLEVLLHEVLGTQVVLTALPAVEEDHVPTMLGHEGVAVEGGLGPGVGNVQTVGHLFSVLGQPGWVAAGFAVPVHGLDRVVAQHGGVDVADRVEDVHLLEDAGQVAHGGLHGVLELGQLSQEPHLVLLGGVEVAGVSLPLPPAGIHVGQEGVVGVVLIGRDVVGLDRAGGGGP